jgi:hypothetical protein
VARSGSFCSAGQCSDDHRTLVDPRTVHPECARLRTIAHCNPLSYHVLRSRRTPSEVGCWSENVVVRAECNTGWRLVPVGDLVLVSMWLFVRRVTLSTDPFAFFIALNFCFRAVFLLWARCEPVVVRTKFFTQSCPVRGLVLAWLSWFVRNSTLRGRPCTKFLNLEL